MRYWVVGDFFDETTRLIGKPNGFDTPHEAEDRLLTIEAQQTKPHHVDYRIVEANNLADITSLGILTMGYP